MKCKTPVSRSSMKAEYRSLAYTASEFTWVNIILCDLRIPQPHPALLRCDNLSTVKLSANLGIHSRSKHIYADYHYTRERVVFGLPEIHHTSNRRHIY